jgi:archaellum biogenesis ATPase FlaH
MEMFIKAQSDKKILLDSQQRALKHISSLNPEGDISLIHGGAGTGKTFVAL